MNLSNFDILWIESCTYLSETGIPKHKHEFFHFIYVDIGVGEITIGETRYAMNPGNIYLVSSFVDHTFFNTDKTPLKTLEIKFSLNDEETVDLIRRLPVCVNVKSYPIKNILLTILNESLKELPMSENVISLNFQLMLTYLLRCYESLPGNSKYNNSRKKFSPEIDKVINYIYENLTEDISLEKLANIAGFEKNYFLRKFKRQTKRTPMIFIRDKRIEKAKELLRYSDMNISQIALATGFKSIHYFSKVFFECMGMRPLSYRDKNNIK